MLKILLAAVFTTLIPPCMAMTLKVSESSVHQHQGIDTLSMDTESVADVPFGLEGNPKNVTRTITIEMSDKMRYAPSTLSIQRGETIRLVIKNTGKRAHQIVVGTMYMLKKHRKNMLDGSGMEHDSPFMFYLEPGQQDELVWEFTEGGTFYYGCLIPGHSEAGMLGKIQVSSQ